MRNIEQYPVTRAEKLAALSDARDILLAQHNVGDIRPYALLLVREEWSSMASEGASIVRGMIIGAALSAVSVAITMAVVSAVAS